MIGTRCRAREFSYGGDGRLFHSPQGGDANGRRQAERAGLRPASPELILTTEEAFMRRILPLLSHSPLCPCQLLESVPMVHGARITALAWKG